MSTPSGTAPQTRRAARTRVGRRPAGLGRLLSRRVGVASSVVLALVATLLVWFATRAEGETVRRAELNDGGVWVSHGALSRFGRINKPAAQLDAAVASPTPPQTGLDILQDGAAVLGYAKATNQVYPINVRTGTLGESAALTLPSLATGSPSSGGGRGSSLPSQRQIDLRGGSVAVVEPITGKLRVQRVDPAVGITVLDKLASSIEPVATIGGPAVVAVGVDGTVYAASAGSGQLAVVRPLPTGGFAPAEVGDLGFTSSSIQLTVVGTRWVVFDPATGLVRADGLGAPVDLRERLARPGQSGAGADTAGSAGSGAGAPANPGGAAGGDAGGADPGGGGLPAYGLVQQPGPEADSVVLAAATGTVAVPLVGDRATTGAVLLPASVVGSTRPALTAPVRLGPGSATGAGSCVHAAWAIGELTHYGRVCGGGASGTVAITGRGTSTAPAGQPAGGGASTGPAARSDGVALRVNRGLVVLNDLDTGDIWDIDTSKPSKIDDWASVVPPPKQGDLNKKATPDKADDQQVRRPPEAGPDDLTVRPGRTSTLHVLDNDTDTQGAVLAIAPGDVGTPDVPGIQVSASVDGQTIAVSVPDHPAGKVVHFTYGVNNGTTGPDGRAVGQVTLRIADDAINTAPHLRQGTARLASTRTPVNRGGSVAVAVLADWRDDENDPLVVEALDAGASVDAAGALAVTAGQAPGNQDVRYRVDDGRGGRTEAKAAIAVLGPSDRAVPPVAQADVVRAVTGKPVQLQPLGNDIPGADPLEPSARMRLAAEVRGPTSLELDTNLETGVVTVTGSAPGSYLLTYAAQVGSAVAAGRFRVDVLAPPTEPLPPVAAPDAATLREQAPTVADVLANDYSPRSDVLAIQSVAIRDAWVRAWVVQGRWLRVQAISPLPQGNSERRGVVAYTVSDGTRTAIGELSVVQKPAPPAAVLPTIVDDQATVRWGDVVTIPALDNDSMADGVPLRLQPAAVKVISGGGRVYVSGVANGASSAQVLRYLPDPGPITADKPVLLEYAAYPEGMPERAVSARIQVTVKPLPTPTTPDLPPAARSFAATVTAGDTLSITVPTSGVDPDGDLVFVDGIVGAEGGPVQLRLGRVSGYAASTIRYQAYPLAAGTEVIRYVVADRFGKTGVGLIRVGVVPPGVPQPPVAVADEVVAAPGRVLHVDVLGNDLVPRRTAVSLEDPVTVNAGAALQQFTKEPDNTFTVTAPDEGSPRTLVYGITSGLFDPSRATVTVRGRKGQVNPPIAVDDTARITPATLAAGVASAAPTAPVAPGQPGSPGQPEQAQPTATSVLVDVLANDRDIDNDTGSGPQGLRVVEVGEGATITPDGVRVSFAAYPRAIPYVVQDLDGATAMALIYVPANGSDTPSLVPDKTISLPTDSTTAVRLGDYVLDPRGRSVRVTTPDRVSTSPAQHLSATVTSAGELALTASDGYVGPGALMLEVTDSTGPDDQAPRTAYLVIPVQVGPLTPLLRCPTWEVVVVADGADRVVDIPQLCAAWFPEGFDQTGLGYAAQWRTPVEHVTLTPGGEGQREVTVAADADAVHGAKGEFLVGLQGSDQRFPVQVRVLSLKQASTAPGQPGAVDPEAPPPPPPAVLRPARVDGLKAGQSQVVNLAQYLDSPFGTLHCSVSGVRVLSSTAGAGVSGTATGCVLTVSATADAAGVTVLAVDVSDGPERVATGTVTVSVLARPTPPQSAAASADRVQGGAVTVSWRPVAFDGGQPVLGYRVTMVGGRSEACGLVLSCTITGLTNGLPYAFTVAAYNDVGWSDESGATDQVKPDTAPLQPILGAIGADDQSLTITWSAPENRGSPITGYRVTLTNLAGGPSPAGQDTGPDARSLTVSGLSNNAVYQVRVAARNELDWGPPSAPAEKQPVGTPYPVTGVAITPSTPTPAADTAHLVISWQAPDPNGPALTTFHVHRNTGGGWVQVGSVSAPTTQWSDEVGYAGQTVSYAVTAVNGGGKQSRLEGGASYTAIGVPQTPAPPAVSTAAPDTRMTVHAVLGSPRAASWVRLEYRTTSGVTGSLPCVGASGCTVDATVANGQVVQQQLSVRGCVDSGGCSDWSAPSEAFQPYGPTLAVSNGSVQVTGSKGDYTVTFRWTVRTNGRPVTVEVVSLGGGTCRPESANPPSSCSVSTVPYDTLVRIEVRTSSAAGNVESVTLSVTTPPDLPPELTIAPGAICTGTECGPQNATACPAGTKCAWVTMTTREWEDTRMTCTVSVGGTQIGTDTLDTNTTVTSRVAYGAAQEVTVTCRNNASGETVTARRVWVNPPE